MNAWILGIAGVGAPGEATGASNNSTSSASLSVSSALSEICDMLPFLPDDAEEYVGVSLVLLVGLWRESGEGELRLKVGGASEGAVFDLMT